MRRRHIHVDGTKKSQPRHNAGIESTAQNATKCFNMHEEQDE